LRNPTNGGRITEIPYVAADVETTGLPRPTATGSASSPCSASCGDGDRLFVSLVNPLRPIDPGASAVNGITDDMVACAPTFADLLPRILDFLADDPLVSTTRRSTCRSFGARRGSRGIWPGNRVIDTLTLARRTGRFRSHSLPNICRELGIGSTFHRAEADAWAAGKLLLHLHEER